MFRRCVVVLALSVFANTLPGLAAYAQRPAMLTATQIVDRNVAARGGLEQWRAVETLMMSGTMEAGGNSRTALPMPGRKDRSSMPAARPTEQVRLPFVMDLKRPMKTRVELDFKGQTALQVYDGAHGWKLRPFLNRREIEPYTEDEIKSSATQAELDGPLVDYAKKGTTVALIGTEKVEGNDTYRLRLTLKSGRTQDVWIDASTFLEAKVEGNPRRLDGREHQVEVFYRDFRLVSGLQLPFVLETRVLNGQPPQDTLYPTATEQIHLDRIQVNPKLNDALFTRNALEAAAAGAPLAAAQ